MTLIESSLIFTLLSSLRQRLAALWDSSATRQVCLRLGRWIRDKVRGSVICDFVWREGTLPRQWQDSWSRSLFTGLLNLPCALVRWIYKVGRKLWDGSFFFRCLSALGGHAYLLLGLLVVAVH